MGMDFAIGELMDEGACYRCLVGWLHPGGLACPRCGAADGLGVHRRHRDPVLDYRCAACGRVFNALTGTALARARRRPSQLVLVLRGLAKGEPTAQLARELHASRGHLLELRHRLQANVAAAACPAPLPGDVAEADEMFPNAGEKRAEARRRPAGPAAAAGQPVPRPRDLGPRPPARARRRLAGRR